MKLQNGLVVALSLGTLVDARLFRIREPVEGVANQGKDTRSDGKPSPLTELKLPEEDLGFNFFESEANLIRYLGVGSLPSVSQTDAGGFSGDPSGDSNENFELCGTFSVE